MPAPFNDINATHIRSSTKTSLASRDCQFCPASDLLLPPNGLPRTPEQSGPTVLDSACE